jgi:CIC family chloride channel protein
MGGMLLVGAMMYGSFVWLGHYYVEGVGYATVQDVLSDRLTVFWLLLLLFVMKLAATCLTLGSGASGGIFSPALFLGSTFGAAYGALLELVVPGLGVGITAFAVAGMAGVVGGSTGAAMAAIVMIFEMTRDYDVIVPMTLTVAASYGVRRMICPESIYTMKLARRGHTVPDSLQANLPRRLRARHIMDTHLKAVPVDMPVPEFLRLVADHPQVQWYLLGESQPVQGIVAREAVGPDLDADAAAGTVAGLASRNFVFVGPDATLSRLADELRGDRAQAALVGDADGPADRILGIVAREQIEALQRNITDLFGDG